MMLQSNIDELKDKSIEEIKQCLDIGADGRYVIGKNVEFFSKSNGSVRMDSVFNVTIPGEEGKISVIVNVEGQDNSDPGYSLERRAEYYVGRMISSQKGRYFRGEDYDKLRKVYSIWLVFNPKAEYRNTAVRYSMAAESLSGDPDRKIPVVDAFNIYMINLGPYDEHLPDVSAFPAALFSKLPGNAVYEIMKDRFNIEYDDVLREGVEKMSSLRQDTYNRGYRDGVEKMSSLREDTYNRGYREGREEGREEGMIDSLSETIVLLMKNEGWSIEKALSLSSVPDSMKESVRKEVLRRLE